MTPTAITNILGIRPLARFTLDGDPAANAAERREAWPHSKARALNVLERLQGEGLPAWDALARAEGEGLVDGVEATAMALYAALPAHLLYGLARDASPHDLALGEVRTPCDLTRDPGRAAWADAQEQLARCLALWGAWCADVDDDPMMALCFLGLCAEVSKVSKALAPRTKAGMWAQSLRARIDPPRLGLDGFPLPPLESLPKGGPARGAEGGLGMLVMQSHMTAAAGIEARRRELDRRQEAALRPSGIKPEDVPWTLDRVDRVIDAGMIGPALSMR